MFDESRPVEVGCSLSFSASPSAVFLPDLPELFEKSSLQHEEDPLQLRADCDSGMPACREPSEFLRPSEDETSEVGGGLVFDGPDDLEALLGFGHEDNDHLRPIPVDVGNESLFELVSMRKRPCLELEDDDEVESKLCHNMKRQKSGEVDTSHEPGSADASVHGAVSAITQPFFEEEKFEDEFCLDQSTDELQMLCDDFGFDMPEQHCSSWNPDGVAEDSISSGSARQSRRQKIKATVKLLREAIPGGDCMDTAIVLDEAINYVKLLQLQVQALGAQRLAQRAGR